MRSSALLAALLFLFTAAPAGADEVVFRGNYWRDRNTRVLQPEADLSKELPSGTTVGAHYLLDAITSASVAAGVIRDEPFTELRHEVGFRLGQRLGPALLGASYSYSSESDYWAHLVSVSTAVDLFQRNTTLALAMSYGLNTIAARVSPTVYNPLGGLQTFHLIASWSQVLSSRLLMSLSYELGVLGFGSEKGKLTGTPTEETGFQANAYRTVNVGGSPARDLVPLQRIRHAAALTLHAIIPTGGTLVPWIALRPGYRFYWDDWGIRSHAPELRTFLPIGPVELRLTGRYYTQGEASFASTINDRPMYPGQGKTCSTCRLDESRTRLFYTADPKLTAFSSVFLELRLLWRLTVLRRWTNVPLIRWLSDGLVEVSYGHYFNDRAAHLTFGDAEVAGLTFSFPL